MKKRKQCVVLLLIAVCFEGSHAAAQVQLSQETLCRTGGPCLLKCSVVSGTNLGGLGFSSFQGIAVACNNRDSCISAAARLYNLTQVDYSTSYLEIRNFSVLHQGTWSCFDANASSLTNSSIQVHENVVPSGELTFGSPCDSGSVTSPASLTCSGLSPGVPSANLTLTDPSNQTVGSSQTGSVTGTVTRGGQYTCSVQWSALPNYSLNISPVQCTVQVPPSVVPGNGSTVDVVQGLPTTLLCNSAGFPRPAFSWSHPGTAGTSPVNASVTRGSLTLVPDRSNGTLQVVSCTASNFLGSSSASVSINVLSAPNLPLPSDPPVQFAERGERVTLFRTVYSVPPLTNYSWFFNSGQTPLSPSDHNMTSSPARVLIPVHGRNVTSQGRNISLEVRAGPLTVGRYTLQACNALGCSTASLTLQETGAPSPPADLRSVSVTSESVTLSWLTGSAGGDFDRWFLVEFRCSRPRCTGQRSGAFWQD